MKNKKIINIVIVLIMLITIALILILPKVLNTKTETKNNVVTTTSKVKVVNTQKPDMTEDEIKERSDKVKGLLKDFDKEGYSFIIKNQTINISRVQQQNIETREIIAQYEVNVDTGEVIVLN